MGGAGVGEWRGLRWGRPPGIILLAAYFTAAAILQAYNNSRSLLGVDGVPLGAIGPLEGSLLVLLAIGTPLLSGVVARGLWHGRSWAWYLLLAFLVIGLLPMTSRLLTGDRLILLFLAVNLALIVYLLRPRVRAHFRTESPT